MSRTASEFQTQNSDQVIQYIAANTLQQKGYMLKPYRNTTDMVWQKGDGFLTAKQYIKVISQNGRVHLEAWMAAFGDCGEMKLTGFWGWAIKKMMRDQVQALTAALHQKIYMPGTAPVPPHSPSAQPAAAQAAPAQQVPVAQPASQQATSQAAPAQEQ